MYEKIKIDIDKYIRIVGYYSDEWPNDFVRIYSNYIYRTEKWTWDNKENDIMVYYICG